MLASELRRISRERPRAGYRMATALLRRGGMLVSKKTVQRVWRREGLRVARQQCKRRRQGGSANSAQRRAATRINEVWSYDFVFDQTEDGRRLKKLPETDGTQLMQRIWPQLLRKRDPLSVGGTMTGHQHVRPRR